jgi:hypothetical protein
MNRLAIDRDVAMPMIARYAISHLSRPLPMMRW